MIVQIPDVLTASEIVEARTLLENAEWVDGKVTAGYQSARTKDNLQIPEDHLAAKQVGEMVLNALDRNPLFMAAALPHTVFPPLFNCYRGGQSFGTHVDNAVRFHRGSHQRIRTDLSATLFFTGPNEYEGGELLIEDTYGAQSVKLPAGHMILYPATSLHRVTPVTSGARVCSFFWIQSMIRGDAERSILFELDVAVQRLAQETPNHLSAVQLTGVYHNLLRRWAEM